MRISLINCVMALFYDKAIAEVIKLKLKIKSCKYFPHSGPIEVYWTVTHNGNSTNYPTYAGAYEAAKKLFKRYYKESSAFSMLEVISVNLLSVSENDFVKKLKRTKCKGITKAQYGYLKGIHERQQRDW